MIAMHMFAFVDSGISLIQEAQVQFVCSGLTHFSGEGGGDLSGVRYYRTLLDSV